MKKQDGNLSSLLNLRTTNHNKPRNLTIKWPSILHPPSANAQKMINQPTTSQIITQYTSKGFQHATLVPGNTGSTILINKTTKVAVKINYDTAFNAFAYYASTHTSPHLPSIYGHFKFGTLPNYGAYTVTEMELLTPLNTTQTHQAQLWADSANQSIVNKEPIPAFNGLEHACTILQSQMTNGNISTDLQYKHIGLDLKAENIMIRSTTNEWVLIDGLG